MSPYLEKHPYTMVLNNYHIIMYRCIYMALQYTASNTVLEKKSMVVKLYFNFELPRLIELTTAENNHSQFSFKNSPIIRLPCSIDKSTQIIQWKPQHIMPFNDSHNSVTQVSIQALQPYIM